MNGLPMKVETALYAHDPGRLPDWLSLQHTGRPEGDQRQERHLIVKKTKLLDSLWRFPYQSGEWP